MISRWFFPVAALAVGFVGARVSKKVPADPPSPNVQPAASTSPASLTIPPASAPAPAALLDGLAYDGAEVQRLLAAPSEIHRLGGLRLYFRRMSPSEFQRAFDDLFARGEKSQPALASLCKCWAALAPTQALQQAQRMEGDFRKQLIAVVMNGWAERDAARAREGARGLAARDQEVALNAIKAVEGYLSKNSAADTPAATKSGRSNRDIFWANVNFMNGGHSWDETATKAFAKWAREDPAGATKEIANSALATGETFLMELYEAWKEKDPAKAEDFLRSLNEYQRNKVMGERVAKMAVENVAAARALAEAAPDLGQRAQLTYRVAHAVWEKQPELAIEILLATSEEIRTANYPSGLVGMWLRREPEKAAAWVRQDRVFWKEYEAGKLGRMISGSDVLTPWVQKDPIAAANFALKMHPKEYPDLMSWIGAPWIKTDPRGACQWAASLPADSAGQPEALKQFIYLWAQQDMNAATVFFDSLPKGAGKTGAAEGYAFSVFGHDPDAALKATRAIPEEAKKLDVLGRAWGRWHSKNSRAASEWAEKNRSLTLEEREKLTEQ